VRLVVSDSHKALVAAIEAVLPSAAWQRCRTHFMRTRAVPRAEVCTAVRGHPRAHDLRSAECGGSGRLNSHASSNSHETIYLRVWHDKR